MGKGWPEWPSFFVLDGEWNGAQREGVAVVRRMYLDDRHSLLTNHGIAIARKKGCLQY